MSQPHEIAIIQVSSVQEETIRVADVLGRVPTREIVEVLDADPAWQALTPGRVYQREIGQGVGMEIRVAESGEVRLHRRMSEDVLETQSGGVRARQQQVLREVEPAYNLAFNEVLARALTRAVPNRARELGYLSQETPVEVRQENGVYEMVLELNV